MNIFKLLGALLLITFNQVFAQEYFQQEVNYKIDVRLNDTAHSLSAYIEMEYINNSPQELGEIFIHLWPNAYKNQSTALAKQLLESGETKFYYSTEAQRGFIDSLDFMVNNERVKFEFDENNIDFGKIILNAPLKSGSRIKISTPFFVKIPEGIFSRLGHLEQAYQITQWYPKPAVFDKNGWNAMPYLNQGEFYSEFGSFDVSITLPQNYIVGATGDMVDGENEIQWLNQLAEKAANTDEFPKTNETPLSDPIVKTLRYKQSNVHDFAWFADKRWNVLKSEVELPHSKRKVTLWSMFTNSEADLWKKSIEYLHDAVYYYSLWNGDYPYNHVTAVDGALTAGGGMEYPNITVIGTTGSAFSLETVIMHEVGHNWFYGILGSNEREHPWLDEGLNSFNENRYIETKYPAMGILGNETNSLLDFFDLDYLKHKAQYELTYLFNARRNLDQPIELPAKNYTEINYGGIVYAKTALVFDYLMAYLGQENFDKAMQSYYETWKFKHPQPEDLKKVFEEQTGKDLNWFFNDVINTTKKIDYSISQISKSENNFTLNVKNEGEIVCPFSISAIENGLIRETHWYEGFKGIQEISFPMGNYTEFKIDAQLDIPEINRRNNSIKTSGVFKTIEPIKLQFLASVENPDKSQVFYTPIMGWNAYNKLMLGTAFYNNTFPQKKFEYLIAPMFSFGTNTEAGTALLAYNFYPNSELFQNIRLSATGSKYAYGFNIFDQQFTKLTPKLEFEIKKSDARSPISKFITLRSVNISQDVTLYEKVDTVSTYYLTQENYYVNEFALSIQNNQVVNPHGVKATVEQGENFVKASIEGNYSFSYKKKNKAADIRFFAGQFIQNDNADTRYFLSMNGDQDYTFDHIYLGRNENSGVLSHQFAMREGGFKNYSTIASTGEWLASINAQVSVPFKLPMALYGDLGFAAHKDSYTTKSNITSAWNTGIAVVVVPKIFEVYFPLAMSSDLNQLSYFQKVRFVLNLNSIDPFKKIREFNM